MLWGENRGKWKRPAAAGSRTQDTSGLSHQCSAIEPRQLERHQPSQSSIQSTWVLSWWRFCGWPLTVFWQHILSWLPGVRLRHSVPPAVHSYIEECEGWCLSGSHGSVAEHWRLKPEVSWVKLRCYEAKIEENEKTGSRWKSNSDTAIHWYILYTTFYSMYQWTN